jgi:hypothetical protein
LKNVNLSCRVANYLHIHISLLYMQCIVLQPVPTTRMVNIWQLSSDQLHMPLPSCLLVVSVHNRDRFSKWCVSGFTSVMILSMIVLKKRDMLQNKFHLVISIFYSLKIVHCNVPPNLELYTCYPFLWFGFAIIRGKKIHGTKVKINSFNVMKSIYWSSL